MIEKLVKTRPEMPPALAGLSELPSRCEVMDADAEAVKAYIARHA